MLANLIKGAKAKAKVNFNTWSLDAFAESWDDEEYFKNLFSNKDEVYEMVWDGEEFWELVNVSDERNGTLFENKDLILL